MNPYERCTNIATLQQQGIRLMRLGMQVEVALAVLAFAACAAHAGGMAHNATELRDLLRGDAAPVMLEPIKIERGCNAKGCVVDADELRIDSDQGGFARASGGKRLRLVEHKARGGDPLPDMAWASPDAYRVTVDGKRWGTCLEFPHIGIGQSGAYQRWTTVVLVPFHGAQLGGVAHRFVGYWAGCDALQTTARRDQVLLPVVERSEPEAARSIRLVDYMCSKNCTRRANPRAVNPSPGSETGLLEIGER